MEQQTDVAVVGGWVRHLADLDRDVPDAERIDLVRELEILKAAAAACQARLTSDFDASQREEQEAAGVPAQRVGRGVAEQVALARRDSAHRGGRHLGAAKALTREMPHTLVALTWGRISEWRATLLVRETAYLSREHRAVIDAELAGPDGIEALAGMSDREVVAAAQRIAYRLDARAVTDRARRAETQRRVTLRPAPDTMSYLTGLLPVAQGVACLAVLTRAADAARAAGDERSRGQVMADTLVAALDAFERPAQGAHTPVSDPTGPAASVALQLVMTDRALLAGADEPAHLTGYGTVPAGWARDLLRDTAAAVWVRRLYTHPETGELLAADARARLFRGSLRQVLIARDQWCRTPWCDGPVRHADHVLAHVTGGPTSQGNGQGLCERCNHAKQAPGWTARASSPPGDRHTVSTTTPTGHRYRSRAPALPGAPHAPPRRSRLEIHFADLVLAC
ncbi:MAG TPA: DUF222 domain-containing protein [Nocardioides sp.]|nr:DUF222 domain-containing protein [Nocardioides sp.]